MAAVATVASAVVLVIWLRQAPSGHRPPERARLQGKEKSSFQHPVKTGPVVYSYYVEGSLPEDSRNGIRFCGRWFDRREVRLACRGYGADLEPLGRLPLIREVVLDDARSNLDVLRKLKNLTSLQIWQAGRGVRSIEKLAGLERIHLDYPTTWAVAYVLRHADRLPKLRSLKFVWPLAGGRPPFLYRLDKLKRALRLEELELSIGEVRDFRALYGLPNLHRLILDRMRIRNVEQLALIRSLRYVWMSFPQVSLRGLDELRWMRPDVVFDISDAEELPQDVRRTSP